MPKPGGWIELSHVCPWLHWLGKLCQTTCFKHQKHGDDYSQIDNESAGCRDAMIAMGLLVVQLTAPRPAATMKTWKTSQSTLKSWGARPRNVQNHGWRGSEQFEENWWWNMQLFMLWTATWPIFWVVCTSFTAKDFCSGGRSSVVDFWKPMLSIVHGPEPKEPLGAGSVLARRASRCEPLLEKNLEQLELAKKIPKLKNPPKFWAETDGKNLYFPKFRFIIGFTVWFTTLNERKISLSIRW